jgi:hypothetical protein
MKRVLVVLFMLCLAVTAFAQTPMSIGFQAGLNFANLSISPTPSPSPGSRMGFGLGGVLEIGINEMFFIQPELMYLMGGAKTDVTGGTITIKYDVIEIPILAKAKFGTSEIKPYAMAGPNIGFTMKSEMEQAPTGGTATTTDLKNNTEGMNLALDFGGGAEYALDAKTTLFGDIRYSLGLTNLDKAGGGGSTKTTGFQLFVGMKFGM